MSTKFKKVRIEDLTPYNDVIIRKFNGDEFYEVSASDYCLNASGNIYIDDSFRFILIVGKETKRNLDYFCGFEYVDEDKINEVQYNGDYVAYIYADEEERVEDIIENFKSKLEENQDG
jgi:hypothetical protein